MHTRPMSKAAEHLLRRLLRQARRWFAPHATRADAVHVQADPREVRRWMQATDRALLGDAAPGGHDAGAPG